MFNTMDRNIFFSLISLILSFLPAINTKGAEFTKKDQFGIDVLIRATDIICFYEQFIALLELKPIPLDRNLNWHCFGQTKQLIDWVKTEDQDNNVMNVFQSEYRKQLSDGFKLPQEYYKKCDDKISNGDNIGNPLYTKAVKDDDKKYPMKTFIYCLLEVLQKKYGEKVFETYDAAIGSAPNWRQSVLAHLNRIRSRHGSPPLELDASLQKNAQTAAIKYATSCIRERSPEELLRKNNQPVYEITACATSENPIVLAYYNLNYWYADGLINFDFKNKDNAKRFYGDAIYMAQLIWKKTTKVGLGFAYSKDCLDKGERAALLALHFFPAQQTGNSTAMKQNMMPPKN